MTIQEIVLSSNIVVSLLPSSYGNKVKISPDIIPYSKEGYTIIDERRDLIKLTAINYIQSLEEVPYPEIPVTASDSEKSLILLNLQWLSPRMHLNTWIDNTLVDVLSLLTPKPYPYSNIELRDFSFYDEIIYASITDVGYGYLTADDSIVIIGEFIRHIWIEKEENLTVAFNNISTSLQSIATAISELQLNITVPDGTGGGNGDTGGGDSGSDENNNTGDDDFMPLSIKTSDYTITSNGERIACFTENGDFTITLPANPARGWEVEIIFLAGGNGYNIPVDLNGKNLLRLDEGGGYSLDIESIKLTNENRGGKLIYSDPNWEFYPNSSTSNGVDINLSFSITLVP
ncbi:hypothetical protein [Anabaena sp. PCC 7108]|uniref:hypothetical protein n=1 Tax=Anabaena sp. PCC 7108 TaxID=163908 RepID=UPI0003452CD7|nr:hypothetical protein [Anabaena sp. PCC 7108]